MTTAFDGEDEFDSLSKARWIDRVCDRFELAWNDGAEPEMESYLVDVPKSIREPLILELVGIDIEYRRNLGIPFPAEEYLKRYPELTLAKLKPFFDKTIDLNKDRSRVLNEHLPVDHSNLQPDRKGFNRTIQYFGDYELLEKTARGGMGTVYRARQISLNRIVAIKMINSGQFASSEEIKRFYSEAESAASLDHPNIVPVYEVGEFEGDHFYAMAYVDGRSLAAKLAEGPMEPREAARLLKSVALAVHYAHQQGVIHRDLKPSNILLDRKDRPRVTDFGLAKRMTDGTGLTLSGEILGTPSYMPPEQAAGKINAVGFGSDVYALGAVLYTCLSGRPPFQAANHVATLKQVIESEPVALRMLNSAVPRDLETVAHKCLEKSIAKRYASPNAFAEDLDRYLTGVPIMARPIGSLERGWRWCRRHPAQTMNAVALLLLVFGLIAGWTFVRSREREIAAVESAKLQVGELNSAQDADLARTVLRVWRNSKTIPLLREQYEQEAIDSRLRAKAAIGLMPTDPSVLQVVGETWLDSSWTEWNWLLENLLPHRKWIVQWTEAVMPNLETERDDTRFVRMVAIKSAMEAGEEILPTQVDSILNEEADRVVSILIGDLRRDPTILLEVSRAFRKMRVRLGPILAQHMHYARKDGGPDALIAAKLFAEMFQKEPSRMIEFGWSARSDLLPVLFERASDKNELREVMLKLLRAPLKTDSWEEQTAADRKRAVAGAVLYGLGEFDIVWPLLSHDKNGSTRSLLIDWIPLVQPDPTALIRKLKEMLQNRPRQVEQTLAKAGFTNQSPSPWLFDPETSQLRALLQILGSYPALQIQRHVDAAFWKQLLERYEFDPDSGIHGSSVWALKQMKQFSQIEEVDSRLIEQRASRDGWFVAPNGHTMATIRGPIEYLAGADLKDPYRTAGDPKNPKTGQSKPWSEDHRHPKLIERSFAIAMYETSLNQMDAMDPDFHERHNITVGPTMQHPVTRVTWHRAAGYCNYLSAKEGLSQDEFCFIETTQTKKDPAEKKPREYEFAPNYLERKGYRLPTEAEWEYACRAGTETRWYLGNTDELLMKHIWFIRNSEEKVLVVPGTLSPNEVGLFESLGNVLEWCMDPFDVTNPGTRFAKVDTEMPSKVQSHRILRGGSLYSMHYALRASEYYQDPPSYSDSHFGFRVARTLRPK